MSKRTTSQSIQGEAGPSKSTSKKISASSSGHFAQVANVKRLSVEDFTSFLNTVYPGGIKDRPILFSSNVTHVPAHTYPFTFDRTKRLAPWAVGGETLYADVPDQDVPRFMEPDFYRDFVAPNLWHALSHLMTKQYLSAQDLRAIQLVIFVHEHSNRVAFDSLPGSSLSIGSNQAPRMQEELYGWIKNNKPRFVWIIVHCTIGNNKLPHWVGTLYEVRKRQLMVFDSMPNEGRALAILDQYRLMWSASFPDIDGPARVGVLSGFPAQQHDWTCGLWCVEIASLIFRYPSQWNQMSQNLTSYDEATMVKGWERAVRKYIQVKPRNYDLHWDAPSSPAASDLIKNIDPVDLVTPEPGKLLGLFLYILFICINI